jgi:hypothetical protein
MLAVKKCIRSVGEIFPAIKETMVSILSSFGREEIYLPLSRFTSSEKPNVLRQDRVNIHNPRFYIFMDGCGYCVLECSIDQKWCGKSCSMDVRMKNAYKYSDSKPERMRPLWRPMHNGYVSHFHAIN